MSPRTRVASGGYDFVVDALFSELDVDGFFLEYDDERSGGFEPLRLVPPGKTVVLGLVTTKRPELESKDELKRRIDEAFSNTLHSGTDRSFGTLGVVFECVFWPAMASVSRAAARQ
jgi:hypothetical protein